MSAGLIRHSGCGFLHLACTLRVLACTLEIRRLISLFLRELSCTFAAHFCGVHLSLWLGRCALDVYVARTCVCFVNQTNDCIYGWGCRSIRSVVCAKKSAQQLRGRSETPSQKYQRARYRHETRARRTNAPRTEQQKKYTKVQEKKRKSVV